VLVAPRVKHLHVLDASPLALETARQNLAGTPNVSFHLAGVDSIPLPDASLDFAYSLGVLHHVPDTAAAIRDVARKLKHGAPLLIYLYYAFDNRPRWFRAIWHVSAWVRLVVSRLPYALRLAASQFIAATCTCRWHASRERSKPAPGGRDPGHSRIILSRQVFLRDARGCVRSLLHPAGAAIYAQLKSKPCSVRRD
ncbi:MAG TPA: class I SAM-dependent methyltransferase, partial [Burkholderiaceae bacterium]|nr:class I SAM-dependent methyltransferase [Burkholderiaceae bacterium]